jgi:hypothetical protein
MKTPFLLLSFILTLQVSGQSAKHLNNKLSPNLVASKIKLNRDIQQHFFIVASNLRDLKQFLLEKNLQQNVIREYEASNLLVIQTNWKLIDSILSSPLIKFIDVVRTPKEESAITGFDLGTNAINLIHNELSSTNGTGTVVSLKENKPDSNDIDLKGRLISTAAASSIMTSHATIMSTIIAGGGNSYYNGKGVAWGANITSANFATLLPDADDYYKHNSILVQNHSYGTGIENYYGADAAAYDASTITNPFLLHVFSSGNSGDKSSVAGRYAGINGFANLTGSFKMAKNILTVGSIDSFHKVSLLSSRGPAQDGRIRPELVAFGQDGASGAAAIVSGTALLLQQAYKEQNGGQLAPAALIKAILLNTADDVGPKGIDYQSGYGSLNAYNAAKAITNRQYSSGAISQAQVQTFILNVPRDIQQIRITLCWNDVPAVANNDKALINDIDLRLVHSTSGSAWQPWVLNSFPHVDSLAQLPIRKKDSLNNTEQISIDNPAEGTYILEVTGHNILTGPQPYYISYQMTLGNRFQWQFPTATDYIWGGNTNTLRWTSTFNVPSGDLFYSCDGGNKWNLISQNIDLGAKYFQWTAPDTFSTVIFQMQVNNQHFSSDTSTISSELKTAVGFNCIDSFLIYWNKAPNVSSYILYRMGNKYLEPVIRLGDTSIVLQKSVNTSSHYTVATNISGRSGIKSYTFNYNMQGTGCYIKNFLVDLINSEQGSIKLELGTTYNVKDIVIEKKSGNNFIPFRAIAPGVTTLEYNVIDSGLATGGNIYRVRINLNNGKAVYSNTGTIFYLANMNYLVYPSPAKANFQIVSKDIDNAELILYNVMGQRVLVKKLNSTIESISVNHLKKGFYFIQILEKNRKVYQGNIVIQ